MPVVLALNVMDALRAGGGAVDTAELARALGIPVIPVSAALGEGLDALLDAAAQAAHGRRPDPWRALVPGPVQTCVRTLARLLAPAAHAAGLPSVFAATQWLDDGGTLRAPAAAEQAAARMVRKSGLARDEALPTARFAQVDRLGRFFTLPQALPGSRRSARIDRVLTGRYTAYPAMAGLLGGVFYLTFHVIGPCLSPPARARHRLAGGRGRRRAHGAGRGAAAAWAGARGRVCGRGERGGVSAGDPGAVFLSLPARGHGLSRARGLRNGPAAAAAGAERAERRARCCWALGAACRGCWPRARCPRGATGR